ncbi:MAG: hypothetical protein AAF665_16090 [Pseudomonadota bacterium]
MRWHKTVALAALVAGASAPALAQENDWKYQATVYLFTAETTQTVNGNEAILSFSDALENLEGAFMGAFNASNGKWTFIADFMYTDVSLDGGTPGAAFSGVVADVTPLVISGYALYRVHETPAAFIDVGAGFRYFDIDTTVTLTPGALPGRQTTVGDDWTDPVISLNAGFELSDAWSSTLNLDYGSFVSDRETYQLTLTFNYAFTENWVARIGYRYMNVENDGDGVDYSFEQSGPAIGISYRF